MNYQRILMLLACALLVIGFAGCGDSYELQSISVEPTHPNVVGIGGTAQLTVTAHYSNNKTEDVTRRATFQLAQPTGSMSSLPLSAVTINASGLAEAIDGVCTWTVSGSSPHWEYGTDPYLVNIAFGGKTVQGFLSVASIAGCYSPDTPKPADSPTT